jgi:predicted RNA-binding protein with PUA-like domain
MQAMTAQPRPEGTCYWCVKDKPGPTRLVGGPSLAASELCDMVSNMGTFTWDGVRDEASNAFLRKMRAGDTACLFHGGTSERAVVGVLEVMSDPRPDPSAWDPDSPFYDASSPESKPKWHCIDVQLKNTFPRFITLAELNMHDKEMAEHNELISQPRLCIFPAPKDEWDILMSLPEQPPPANLPMPATPAAR